MKLKTAYLFLAILFCYSSAFTQVDEHFDDGNFTQNPTWLGIDSLWTVDQGMLNSASQTTNSTFALSTAQSLLDSAEWSWRSKLNFSTSSQNFVDFHLNNTSSDLSGDSYFLRIGDTKDDISLYKRIGSTEVLLIDGPDAMVPSNSDFVIKVEHQSGLWKVYTKDLKNGQNYFSIMDSVQDSSLQSSGYFGISVHQSTASFFGKHYFDDIVVQHLTPDLQGPIATEVQVVEDKLLRVIFDEAIDSNSISTSSFSISGIGQLNPFLDTTNPANMYLILPQVLKNGVYNLSYSGIKDYVGNTNNQGSIDFDYFKASSYSLLISEVMADFTPGVGMPDCKWIELYNNSGVNLDISSWMLREDSKYSSLPSYTMPPGSYLILVSSNTNAGKLSSYGPVAVANNFPSLAATGSHLEILDKDSSWIYSMHYDKNSYHNVVKEEGGYSLELIDTSSSCDPYYNYTASISPYGGTPGSINSVWGKEQVMKMPIAVSGVEILDNRSIMLELSKNLESGSIRGLSMSDNVGVAIRSGYPLGNTVILDFDQALTENKVYTLHFDSIEYCGENSENIDFDFGIPSTLDSGDIIINEVLYNSNAGYHDWIEVKNVSNKIFSADQLYLASRNEQGSIIDVNNVLSGKQILPGQYYVLGTDNAPVTAMQYTVLRPENVIVLDFSYSLNSDDDFVLLLNKNADVIDELHYFDDWQYPLLNDTKGVSLERISQELKTQDPNNWHSASQAAGWATPTDLNSSDISQKSNAVVDISSPIITPNGDGVDDFILISYNVDNPGYLMDAKIFDVSGAQRAIPVDNQSISTKGSERWDGLDDNGNILPHGPYILWVELDNQKGDRASFRFPITVNPQ